MPSSTGATALLVGGRETANLCFPLRQILWRLENTIGRRRHGTKRIFTSVLTPSRLRHSAHNEARAPPPGCREGLHGYPRGISPPTQQSHIRLARDCKCPLGGPVLMCPGWTPGTPVAGEDAALLHVHEEPENVPLFWCRRPNQPGPITCWTASVLCLDTCGHVWTRVAAGTLPSRIREGN